MWSTTELFSQSAETRTTIRKAARAWWTVLKEYKTASQKARVKKEA
tara:strand:+ start:11249 stop:11386 length:138 start_codon:yes stop_codon:yes gene_type:complete